MFCACACREGSTKGSQRAGVRGSETASPSWSDPFMSTAVSVERLAAHNLMQLALHTSLAGRVVSGNHAVPTHQQPCACRGTTAAPDGGPCFHRPSDQPRKALFPGSFHRLPRTFTRPSRASGVPSSFRSSRPCNNRTSRHTCPPCTQKRDCCCGLKITPVLD